MDLYSCRDADDWKAVSDGMIEVPRSAVSPCKKNQLCSRISQNHSSLFRILGSGKLPFQGTQYNRVKAQLPRRIFSHGPRVCQELKLLFLAYETI